MCKFSLYSQPMSKSKITEILILATIVVAVVTVIRMLFKLDKAAETKIYDNDAINELNSKDSRDKLDKYVEEYYKSGKWNEQLLKES